MNIAKKSNVVVNIGNIRVIRRGTLSENKGYAERDALTWSGNQSLLCCAPRIRFCKPVFSVVGICR